MRMNLPEYHGSIVEECPMEFIDEAYRIVAIMGVPQEKKADFGAYQLNGVANIWDEQWVEERGEEASPIAWEEFKGAFLDRFFSLELRKDKGQELINLKQCNVSVREYFLKFIKLSKYTPFMIANPRARMSKFIFRVLELVCKTIMLVRRWTFPTL